MKSLLLGIVLLTSSAAFAQDISAEEKVARAETELALQKEVKFTNDKCGTQIEAKVVWKSFPKDKKNFSVSGYCESALGALRNQCDGNKAKAAYIKKNVKVMRCNYGKSKEAKVVRKKKTVDYFFTFESSNLDTLMRKELMRSL